MCAAVRRNGYHEVMADGFPEDNKRILPLIGNDELKLCVDARGVMHDWTHIWGSHPPPRITWSGRRHDKRCDRYNSNLFEWGFLDLALSGEGALPPVTAWRQRLHPREGVVETEVRRGEMVERTLSFVHLEQNLIVFRRAYEDLPEGMAPELQATYTLCQVGTEALPFRVRWQPAAPWARGIAADTEADGMRLYRGRVALFCDVEGQARAVDNRLELSMPLPADGAVTVCLALNDDLGDHPQILDMPHSGWMTEPVKEVSAENQARLAGWVPAAYAAETDRLVAALESAGFDGLLAGHKQAWADWFAGACIELPAEEEELRAAFDTQLYTMRCSYTAWSSPANPFNTSWGAPYFWDERFPTEGLMRLGIWDMPERTVEWRRTILPFSTMMSGGRGARYVPSAVETGSQIADRNATQYYEFFTIGVIANYVYEYCCYRDDEATWRRHYPILRECAEFFRRYLLIELPGNNIMLTWLVDVNETFYPVQDGPFATCGAARIFHCALRGAARLGMDEELVPEWTRLGGMVLHLASHLCGSGRLERDGVTTADNPASVYIDYELGDIPAPDLEVDAAIQAWRDEYRARSTPENQMAEGKTNISGEAVHMPFWSWGPLQKAHSAAFQGDAETALQDLRHALTTMMDFGALNESAQVDLSDVHHPWFNTAAGAYVRALTRMLVYPRDGETRVLPGIPAGWRDFSFELPIYRGGTLAVRVTDGVISRLSVRETKEESQARCLCVPKRFLPETGGLSAGVEVIDDGADGWRLRASVEAEFAFIGR